MSAPSTLVDLVKILAVSPGTGAIKLGAAISGYRGSEALTDGAQYSYSIQQDAQWEVGTGTYLGSGNQLTRTPRFSSNGGQPINLAPNAAVAFVASATDIRALSSGIPGPLGPVGPSNNTRATKAALLGAATTDLSSLYDRSLWTWEVGDFTAQVAADPLAGIYVPSATVPVSQGCWVRAWDGVHGRPEWFGAVAGNPAVAGNADAIEACIALCPITLLRGQTYFTTRTVYQSRSDSIVCGASCAYGGGAGASAIALTGSAAASVSPVYLVGGSDVNNPPRGLKLLDVDIIRIGIPPAEPALYGAISLLMLKCSNSTVERVRAKGSPVGFRVTLTATCMVRDCDAQVAVDAGGANSSVYGYLVGGTDLYPGFVGNNGSLRLDGNTAFNFPACAGAWHTAVVGQVADTWLHQLEGAGGTQGILINGQGNTSVNAHQDVIIDKCRMDGFSDTGIFVRDLNASASVQITNHYVGNCGTGIAGLNVAGSLRVKGGEVLALSDDRVGHTYNNVRQLSVQRSYIRDAAHPVVINNCVAADVAPLIYNPTYFAAAAVDVTASARGRIAPSVTGGSTRVGVGVRLTSDVGYLEVNGSAIDPGCFTTVDAQYKVRFNGADARANFGTNLLTGVTE